MRQGIATRPARRWRSWPMPEILHSNAESIDSGLAYALSIATPLFSMLRVSMVFLSTIMRELFGLRGSIEPPGHDHHKGWSLRGGERSERREGETENVSLDCTKKQILRHLKGRNKQCTFWLSAAPTLWG